MLERGRKMHFQLSEEQIAIQDALRGTLANVLPSSRLHEFIDGDSEFDQPSWQALMDLGFGGLILPEKYGGSDLALLDAAIAMEVAGEAGAPGPLLAQILAGLAISACDDEDLREQWLPGIATGERRAALAFGKEWLPESWDVTEANGRISGTVRFVQSGGECDLYLVGLSGGRLAVVEYSDSVAVERVASEDRTRRQSTLTFASEPATILSTDANRIFDAALVLAAAEALGGAQKITDMSVAYAKERDQFGQPIGQFQALKHQLAQMALEVEPARALVWYAAYAFDEALEDAPRAAAIAKAHLADRFTSIGRAGVAAHGGIGYTWEYDLSIWYRRSLYNRAFLGSPAIHRERAAKMAGW